MPCDRGTDRLITAELVQGDSHIVLRRFHIRMLGGRFVVDALRLAVKAFACAPLTWPCLPGAEEIADNQVTPTSVAAFCRACSLNPT